MSLTITAPPQLQQSKCDEAFAQFRKNPPLLFTAATETALDIKRGNCMVEAEAQSLRKIRFNTPQLMLQEVVDQGIYNYVASGKTRHIGSSNKIHILDLFDSGDIIGALKFITDKCQSKIKKLLEQFDFLNCDHMNKLRTKGIKGADEAFYQRYATLFKQRIIGGIENMMDRFFEITASSLLLGLQKYSKDANLINKMRLLLRNNIKFINSTSQMRFDVFNQLSRFLVKIAGAESDTELKRCWQIHNFSNQKTSVDMIAPTEALFKDLIEAYPYADTDFINGEKAGSQTSSPAFGCPAHHVNFPNGLGNMIQVFYRWYLKVLDENFFILWERLIKK